MDELLHRIDGHLQDVNISQRHSLREIDTLKETVVETQTHMASMQTSITNLQADVAHLQTDMVHVQNDLRRMHVSIDGLRVSMVNANTAIVELRGTFASLGVMLKDHARRLNALEDKQAS